MKTLSINHISKAFGSTQALNDVDFDIEEGEILALLGPSGCGKSTLLSLIAGLETPDKGDICWNGVSLANIPPHLRKFGLMFQDFALFPHMNVYANVAFGLKMSRMDNAKIDHRVQEMLSLVGLPEFSNRDVSTLSGGEQQRIALARALAPHPRLLMLDEPLGSLDKNLRERLVIDLQKILSQMKQTAIYVTHDQEEAFVIADRIVLMNIGKVEQVGTPQEIYNYPVSPFVARFLEMTNIIPAIIQNLDGRKIAATDFGSFFINTTFEGKVELLIRPDLAQLDGTGPVKIKGYYRGVSFRGSRQRISLQVNRYYLAFDFPSVTSLPEIGSELTVSINPETAIRVFPA